MKIDAETLKKQVILHLPYVLFLLVFAKLGEAVRLAPGADASQKLLGLSEGFALAFQSIVSTEWHKYTKGNHIEIWEFYCMKAKEKKPSYSRHISTRLWSGGFEKNQSRRFFLLFRRCSCNQEGGIWEDTAMSIFVIHSTHELHQLKKACSQQRSNAVRSMHYTM